MAAPDFANQVPQAPQAQGLDALGIHLGNDPASRQAYAALQQYIASLNPAGQAAAVAFVKAQLGQAEQMGLGIGIGDPSSLYQVPASTLSTLQRTLQSDIGPAGTQYSNTPTGMIAPTPSASASSTSTGTTAPSTGALGAVTETSALTQQQYIDLMRMWGLQTPAEVDDMVRAFQQSYYVTYQLNQSADIVGGPGVSQIAPPSTGATAGTQTGPTANQPSSPFQEFLQSQTALGTAGVGASPWTMQLNRQISPLQQRYLRGIGETPTNNLTTAQDVYAAVIGSSGAGGIAGRILQQYQEKYLNDTGQTMPPDLLASLQAAITGLTASQQQQWLEASIAKPGGSIAIPALDTVLTTYEGEHPTAASTQADVFHAVDQVLFAALHRHATAADLAALGPHPSDIQIQQYVNEQPSPVKGFANYGAYNATYYNLKTQWDEYFGRDPTPQELLWGAGKTPQDITDFIDNSKSSVPGVTIGVKNDYESFINSLDTSGATTHAFSAGVDDSLISSLHQHLQSQATGTPSPGPM